MRALLKDGFKRALGFRAQVSTVGLVHVIGKKHTKDLVFCQGTGMVRAVAADLAEGPRGGCLDVVFWLGDQRIFQWRDTFGHNHCQGKGL